VSGEADERWRLVGRDDEESNVWAVAIAAAIDALAERELVDTRSRRRRAQLADDHQPAVGWLKKGGKELWFVLCGPYWFWSAGELPRDLVATALERYRRGYVLVRSFPYVSVALTVGARLSLALVSMQARQWLPILCCSNDAWDMSTFV
jgi:hypothetical protein